MRERLRAHIEQPLHRTSYLLVLSAGASAVLGMIFWVVAARRYPAEAVGLSAALIGAMTLLAAAGQLNVSSAVVRFMPVAGGRARTLHRACLTVAVLGAGAAAAIFLVGSPRWAPALDPVLGDPALAAWFLVSVTLWSVFVLLDGSLAAMDAVAWVPAKNTVFGVLKLGALLVPWVAAELSGIFLAWTLTSVPVVVAGLVVVRRRLPRLQAGPVHPDVDIVSARGVARFAGADYIVLLSTAGVANLLPLLVLSVTGAAAAAYFSMSWQMMNTVHVIATGVSTALVLEGATRAGELARYSLRSTAQVLALLTPVVVVGVALAPVILAAFGGAYAAEATTVLQLLLVSVLPDAIFLQWSGIERVRRRMRLLVLATLAANVVSLAGGWWALEKFGLTGFGVAWLAARLLAAVVVTVLVLGPLWRGACRSERTPAGEPTG